jgi:hypothetical protein
LSRKSRIAPVDSEVYVLRQITSSFYDFQGIQFARNHTDDLAARIEQGTSAITRLNLCADLKVTGVVQ